MKKETRTYLKNAIQANGFAIDVINMIIGISIIVMAVIALSGEENDLYLFPVIFILGSILTCLNAVKMMKHNRLFGIFFIAFTVILVCACVFSFLVLFSGLTIV